MAINKWRKIEYTDDGCSLYECMLCYGKWESRTSPSPEGSEKFHSPSGWVYCPCCGTKWEGRIWDKERIYVYPKDPDFYWAIEGLVKEKPSDIFPDEKTKTFWTCVSHVRGLGDANIVLIHRYINDCLRKRPPLHFHGQDRYVDYRIVKLFADESESRLSGMLLSKEYMESSIQRMSETRDKKAS